MKLDQKDILLMFFDVLDGDKWPDEYAKSWKDGDPSVCQWEGVTCDAEQKIIGLAIPESV
jgi:Leucine rich repeat N-terminal domain